MVPPMPCPVRTNPDAAVNYQVALGRAAEDRLRNVVLAETRERQLLAGDRGGGARRRGIVGAASTHNRGVVALDTGLALWRFDGQAPGG